MKKYFLRITMIFVLGVSFAAVTDAQIIVKIRPAGPVYRPRPLAPSPVHVWVDGEYVWRGGQYVYTEGYWGMPPRPRAIWIQGHWKHRRGGWFWVPGHWRW